MQINLFPQTLKSTILICESESLVLLDIWDHLSLSGHNKQQRVFIKKVQRRKQFSHSSNNLKSYVR